MTQNLQEVCFTALKMKTVIVTIHRLINET